MKYLIATKKFSETVTFGYNGMMFFQNKDRHGSVTWTNDPTYAARFDIADDASDYVERQLQEEGPDLFLYAYDYNSNYGWSGNKS